MSALRGLDYDYTPDLPPGISIDSLTAMDLREKVVRATSGHYNWTSPDGPKPTEQRTVCCSERRTKRDMESGVRLIYGRDLVLLVSGGRLEIRRLQVKDSLERRADDVVWRDEDPHFADYAISGFDFQLCDNRTAIILAVSMDCFNEANRENSKVCVLSPCVVNSFNSDPRAVVVLP